MPVRRIITIKRFTTHADEGGGTLFFKSNHGPRQGTFYRPELVPEFEGEFATFEIEVHKGRTKFLRRIPDGPPIP